MARQLKAFGAALALLAAPWFAEGADCSLPEEGGTPLRGAVTRVKHLAETEAWERGQGKSTAVKYVLSIDAPRRHGEICYWPVEARAGSETWNTFYVTPGGDRVLVAGPGGKLVTLDVWRKAAR
jgi:hypothetical protein